MNYPDGMTKRDWDHVDGVGAPKPPRPVLRVVMYLHFKDDDYAGWQDEPPISEVFPTYDAERNIEAILGQQGARNRGLDYAPYKVEAVDATWHDSAEQAYEESSP